MLIGICGLQGAGKDTLASVLIKRHGFTRMSFGAALKDVVAAIFSWDRELLDGVTPASREWRERPDEWWSTRLGMPGLTPRKALQVVGTDVLRQGFHADLWVACVERRLDRHPRTVITDCRFPNEIDMVKRHGGLLIHVRRGPLPDWFVAYQRRADPLPPEGVHPSEYAWARHAFDHIVTNDADVESLERWCRHLMQTCDEIS